MSILQISNILSVKTLHSGHSSEKQLSDDLDWGINVYT